MIAGVQGLLVSSSFARDVLPTLPGAEAPPAAVRRGLESWVQRVGDALGPASSVREIAEVAAIPLFRLLGYDVAARRDLCGACAIGLTAADRVELAAVVAAWGQPLRSAWRQAIAGAIATDARWAFCCNGTSLRIVDARRTWAREHLEFDLASVAHDDEARTFLWSIARAPAMAASPPILDTAVELSRRHGVETCRALAAGVVESLHVLYSALAPRAEPRLVFEQSLTVLYRVLFLLFAEARGLVPLWHPVYRDRYSLDAIVAALLAGGRYRGLWHALQAISRLAHAGCAAGELRVTAFNGRLFAPAHARAFDRKPIADDVMGRAVLAVSTTHVARRGNRARIAYRDLDVEQLGAVYEQVLEYEPARVEAEPTTTARPHEGGRLARSRETRKASGTFYTPRAVTAWLVRRTLAPLVRNRTAVEIRALRVLDPAMGSGAFLVGACRYLATAAEEALVSEGQWHAPDVTAADRAQLRREIASKCLFGVDLNPMAVQLARLSLWLVTLAADKPLSFLDHHLVAGDSLVGASPSDLHRPPARRTRRPPKRPHPSLFDADELASVLEHAVGTRLALAFDPEDSAEAVRGKERRLTTLDARDGSLGRWRRALDLWCAGWFDAGAPRGRGAFLELVQHLTRGRSALPAHVSAPMLAGAEAAAAERRFLHWELAFPEVFTDARGQPLAAPGFDAVIGNPPWDVVRGDSGDTHARSARRSDAKLMTTFVRESGHYSLETRAHVNQYQLFVHRVLRLAKPGGRIGLVLPSGAMSDVGAAPLRRYLFDRAAIDDVAGLDNRAAIFPIHRSVRFVLLTATAGRPTSSMRCRFGITRPDDLERDGAPLVLTRALIARLSGSDDLGVPELATTRDLQIVERLSALVPRLGAESGWNARFGRELNASDDRDAFAPATGRPDARPVVEGKQLEPFRVCLNRSRLELTPDAAQRLRIPRRPRLAYRDVASATNRLTLIAGIVPARAVTTHTVFCLKTPHSPAEQHVLCALLNSFVANYLVRLRVTTHVTAALVSRLPVPVVAADAAVFGRLAQLTRILQSGTPAAESMVEYAEAQALAARLYELDRHDFEHVLSTFPLVPDDVKQAALARFVQ